MWYCWDTMFVPNRAWMYDKLHLVGGIKLEFPERVEEFITACVQTEQFTREETISCPYCKCKCKCKWFLDIEPIRYHLYKNGFKLDYWVWIEHGEVLLLENQFGVGYVRSSSIGTHVGNKEGVNMTWEDNFGRYQGMIIDAIGHGFGMYPNLRKRFLIWMMRDFIVY